MLKNNLYYNNDKYLYFSFNGVHSSEYNLFITNKDDLTIENSVGESSEYVSALFQEGSYYAGTKKTQKTFKRKCAAEGLTLSQYKRMMRWLTTGTTGFLVFDNNPWWGWTVVLDSVGDASIMERSDKLLVEFDITFKTVGPYFARNRYAAYYNESNTDAGEILSTCNGRYNETAMCNEFGIPVIFMEESDNIYNYFVQGVNNEHQHLDYEFILDTKNDQAFTLKHNKINYIALKTRPLSVENRTVTASDDHRVKYYGESNLILCNDELIELKHDLLKSNHQPYGILQLQSTTPLEIKVTINKELRLIEFEDEADFDLFVNNVDYNFLCLTKENRDSSCWGGNEGFYPSSFTSFIMYKGLDESSYGVPIEECVNSGIEVDTTVNSGIYFDVDTNGGIVYVERGVLTIPSSVYNTMSDVTDFTEYKCYIGKSNLVQITPTKDYVKIEEEGKTVIKEKGNTQGTLTVVSCNNL